MYLFFNYNIILGLNVDNFFTAACFFQLPQLTLRTQIFVAAVLNI